MNDIGFLQTTKNDMKPKPVDIKNFSVVLEKFAAGYGEEASELLLAIASGMAGAEQDKLARLAYKIRFYGDNLKWQKFAQSANRRRRKENECRGAINKIIGLKSNLEYSFLELRRLFVRNSYHVFAGSRFPLSQLGKQRSLTSVNLLRDRIYRDAENLAGRNDTEYLIKGEFRANIEELMMEARRGLLIGSLDRNLVREGCVLEYVHLLKKLEETQAEINKYCKIYEKEACALKALAMPELSESEQEFMHRLRELAQKEYSQNTMEKY